MKSYLIAIPLALAVIATILFLLLRRSEDEPTVPTEEMVSTEVVEMETPEDVPGAVQQISDETVAVEVAVLVLDEGGASISGRVVDLTGQSLSQADVLLLRAREDDEAVLRPAPVGRDSRDMEDLERVGRSLREQWASGPRLRCDEDGEFSFQALSAGSYRVVARSAAHLPSSTSVLELVENESKDGIVVELESGASIQGFVLNTERDLIEGVRLRVRWEPEEEDLLKYRGIDAETLVGLIFARESAETVSGPDGTFVFSGLVEGDYTLMAEAPTYAATEVEDVPTGPEEVQVVLHPELVVRGRVVNADEEPVRAANVQLRHLSDDPGSLRSLFRNRRIWRNPESLPTFVAQSDADGLFEIRGLPYGTFRATVEHSAFQSSVHPFVAIDEETPDDDRDLFFELDAGHRIVGVIRDESGKGVADVRIEATAIEEDNEEDGEGGERRRRRGRGGRFGRMYERFSVREEDFRTRTDAEGRFELNRLPEGRYDLEIQASSFLTRKESAIATDGEPLEIALASGDVVFGQVLDDETSDPIEGASVRLEPRAPEGEGRGRRWRRWRRSQRGEGELRRARTDAEGKFRIGGLAGGSYELRVQAAGWIQDTSDLETNSAETTAEEPEEGDQDNREVLVRLRTAGSIAGTIRDRQGRELEGLKVRIARVDPEDIEREQSRDASGEERDEWRRRLWRLDFIGSPVVTDEDGNYEASIVRGVEALRVVVEGDPYLAGRSDVVEIKDPGDDVDDIDVTLERSARVSGTVVDANGLALSGADVRVRVVVEEEEEGRRNRRGRWPYLSGSTDGLGRFELSGLNTGKFYIEVLAPDHLDQQSDPFEVSLGDHRTFDFSLEREWTIGGTIYDNSGTPIAGALALTEVDTPDPRAQFWRGRPTTSGPFGTYRLGKLEKQEYDVRAGADGFASRLLRGVEAGSENVDFSLDPLVTIEGLAIGVPSGEPVAQFRARLRPGETNELSAREKRRLDRWQNFDNGEFHFEDVPPATYTLDVEAPGFLSIRDMLVRLTPGETLAEIQVDLEEGGVLTGVVVDLAGQPVPGAMVQTLLKSVDAETGDVSYKPSARSGRGGRQDGGGRGDGRGRRGERRQRERNENNRVRALRNGRAEADEAGQFTVRGLSGGTYKLLVSHDEFVATESRGEYIIERAQTGYLSSIETAPQTLHPGAAIRGRVVVTSGSVSDISVTTRVSYSRKEAFVESTGTFEMRGLAPGTYEIRARRWPPRDGGTVTVEVEVPEGKETVDGVELQVP